MNYNSKYQFKSFQDGNYWRFNDRRFKIDSGDPAFPRPAGYWWFGCPASGSQVRSSLLCRILSYVSFPVSFQVFSHIYWIFFRFVFISFLHRKYSLSFVCHFTCIHVLSLVHILIRKSHTPDQVSVHNESYQDPVRVEGGCYSVYFLTDGRHSNRDHRPLGRRSPR